MLEKKFPEVDLNRQRKFIFLISLIVILSIINVAFEWRSYDDFEQIDLRNVLEYEVINHQPLPFIPPLSLAKNTNAEQDPLNTEIIISVSFEEDYDK